MFFGYDAAQWTAILTTITTLTVLVGTVIAVRNLGIIAKTHRLAAFQRFTDIWQQMREARAHVIHDFVFDPDSPPSPESQEYEYLRTVINGLNEIGLLVEKRLLPAHFVLGLIYPDLVRLQYKLAPYLDHREEELGVRYGRRVVRLGLRARRYHDARPQHREHKVKLGLPNRPHPVVIHQTAEHPGIEGVTQRASWAFRRWTRHY